MDSLDVTSPTTFDTETPAGSPADVNTTQAGWHSALAEAGLDPIGKALIPAQPPDHPAQADRPGSTAPVTPAFVAPQAPTTSAPGLGAAAEGAAAWVARNGLRLGEGSAAAAAILLTPTNTQNVSVPAQVDGRPDLSATVDRAPGSLSGRATVTAAGQDGHAGPSATLAMDPLGTLTAPPGAPGADQGVVGWTKRGDTIELRPGAAEALGFGQSAANRTDAGGAGGKQPPSSVGSVRPDGECDENGNVGPSSPRTRLPKNGTWDGAAGNSGWHSSDPEVLDITKGEPIQFRDGRADFTPWAKLAINFSPGELTGNHSTDVSKTLKILDASGNPDIRAAGSAADYLEEQTLTPHHATDTCMQLVPTKLNEAVAHIGSAADLRYQATSGRTP